MAYERSAGQLLEGTGRRSEGPSSPVLLRVGATVAIIGAALMLFHALPANAELTDVVAVRPTSQPAAPVPSTTGLQPIVRAEPAIIEAVTVVDAESATATRSTVQIEIETSDGTGTAVAPSPVAEEIQPLARPVVVLYGDSLAWEAQDAFVQAFADEAGVDVVLRTYGGTAICDWLDAMAADAAAVEPGAVVVEFSGNALTPCMQDAEGQGLVGTDYFEKYATDAEQVIATFDSSDTQVIFAGAPISLTDEQSGEFDEGRLNPIYRELGERYDDVRYVDAGAVVLDAGRWTTTLPCVPEEPCADEQANVVRAPDGVHFCPAGGEAVRGVTGKCPVWSSGAFRYGRALAQPVIDSLDAVATA